MVNLLQGSVRKEMEEEDEKDKETYVVGALGNVHAT